MSRITVVYFSPTGGTKKAALALASKLAEEVREIALPVPDKKEYLIAVYLFLVAK